MGLLYSNGMAAKPYDAYSDKVSVNNALILIAEIDDALKRGTQHFHPTTGKLLVTIRQICECLAEEGSIVFEPAPNA